MGSHREPYTGPFPRKRHSHCCIRCVHHHGQRNDVACYKSRCTKPQLVETCQWCRRDALLNDYAGDGLDARYEDQCRDACGLNGERE